MAKTFAFGYGSRHLPLLVMTAICLVPNCLAQSLQDGKEAREILRLTDEKQREFVNSVMDKEFPESDGDKFGFLLMNRSELVIPLVEERIEIELRRSVRSERFIDLASAHVAYAGDEQSLRAVSKLIAIDEGRFGPLVGRTLDNSTNWRNPFTVAYRGIEIGDNSVTSHVVAWSESALASDRMKRFWAEAMLDRYGKIPGRAEWAQDPLASQMNGEASLAVRDRVMGLAADVLEKRKRQ